MREVKVYDFFCGVGGVTRGLSDAGLTVVAGIDIDEKCKRTFEHNNPDVEFIHRDIGEMTLADLGMSECLPENNDVLFVACAPCQSFSCHRKWGKVRDRKGVLLHHFGRLVRAALPDYILVENVPGIAKVRGYSTLRRFRRTLGDLDYRQIEAIVDAKRFGVPQNRRRLVLIASRRGPISLPEPSHGEGLQPFHTVRQAIGHFPRISAGQRHDLVTNHVASHVSEMNLRRLCATPADGGDRRSWPLDLWLSCHKGDHAGHTDVYGRMYWDRPSPAITGKCVSISNGRYGHPEQDRAISIREAAALQTFPDRYEFFGEKTNIASQIGNAVPVRLAEKLGKHVLTLAETSSKITYTGESRRPG